MFATIVYHASMTEATLGAKIKLYRLRKDWSVAQLARAAEYTEGAIYHIEAGRRKPMSGTLSRIADALDVSTDDLLGRSSIHNALGVLPIGNTLSLPVLTEIRKGDNPNAVDAEQVALTAQQIPVDCRDHVLCLYPASDDALTPRVERGDLLLICLSETELESGQLALLWDDRNDCNLVRRLLIEDGEVWGYGTNPAWPPVRLDAEAIVGRVIQLIAEL